MNAKRTRFLIYAGISLVMAIIAAVFLVRLANLSTWRYDMTARRLFTLSEQTESIINSIEEPVRIAAIYPSGREDMMVQALLREYDNLSPLISVEFIDAEREPFRLAAYRLDVAAVPNNTLIIQSGERSRMIFSSQLYESTIYGNLFSGEREITGAIRYVITDELPIIYFVEGHGQTAPERMTRAISELQTAAYQVRTLNFAREGRVPEDASILVFVNPMEDLSDEELVFVREYVRFGGNVLLLLDVNFDSDIMHMPNFSALSEDFGVRIPQNILIEDDSDHYLAYNQLYIIPVLAPHQITGAIDAQNRLVILPVARGLFRVEEADAELAVLLASSQHSWARFDLSIQSLEFDESDFLGPIPLAFASFVTNTRWGGDEARAVIIGNASFIHDGNVEVQGNLDLFINTINFLQGDRAAELIAAREINSPRLMIRGSDFLFFAVIILGVLPLIAFGAAFATWMLRRNR